VFDCIDFCLELDLSQQRSVIFPNNNNINNTVVSILTNCMFYFGQSLHTLTELLGKAISFS